MRADTRGGRGRSEAEGEALKILFIVEAKSGNVFEKKSGLPVLPSAGMWVDVDGNYRRVTDVYLKRRDIVVYLDGDQHSDGFLKKFGWKEQ